MLYCSIRSSGTVRLRETGLQKRHNEFTGENKFIETRLRLNSGATVTEPLVTLFLAPTSYSRSGESAGHVVSSNSDDVAVVAVTTRIRRFQLKNACLDSLPIIPTPLLRHDVAQLG